MNKLLRKVTLGILVGALSACSPVKMPVTNQYQLTNFSAKRLVAHSSSYTLLVTVPEAVAGYQTEVMLYIKKPYQLEAFVKNAWIDAPANMLYPLLIQSIQSTGYFAAVSSSPYMQGADYRLDTQLLHLEQNFIKKPSTLEFSVKLVLTRVNDNKIVASRIINQNIACPEDTPYGGVVAANRASLLITKAAARFVIRASA